MIRRTFGKNLVALVLGGLMFAPYGVMASDLEIPKTSEIYVNSVTGIAINGYDPVAYFTEGRHMEGRAEFEVIWKDVPWRFFSAQNRDMFLSAPEDYAPQYGGYGAFAMAHNEIVITAPNAWAIYQGKLYLSSSRGVRERWWHAPDDLIEKADGFWSDVLDN